MKFISSRNNFISDSNLNMINESMLYYSPPFRSILKTIDSEISKALLDVEFTDVKPDMTFIDLEEKPGFISFTQINKAKKVVEDEFPNADFEKGTIRSGEDSVENKIDTSMIQFLYNAKNNKDLKDSVPFVKSRNKTKIGKFINKTFPGKFTDKQIEDFVNKFKGISESDGDKFKMVTGDELLKYYHCDNYENSKGTLGSSCMKNDSNQNSLEWYANNGQSVKLLVLLNSGGWVKARSLVWKINNPDKFEYVMDRIYYNEDHLVEKFKDYAKSKGWAYKTNQSYSSKDISFNGNIVRGNHYITMGYNPDYYPYLDTFSYYDSDKYILSNDPIFGDLTLDGTEGDAMGTFAGDSRIYSEYEGESILMDQSVYSDRYNTYLYDYNAVRSIITNDYLPKDENFSVFSFKYNDYIPTDDAIDVYIRSDRSESDWFLKEREGDEFIELAIGEYYRIDLIIEDVFGDIQLKDECLKVSRTSTLSIDYVSKSLAKGFNIIDETELFNVESMEFDEYILKDKLYEMIFKKSIENPYDWIEKLKDYTNNTKEPTEFNMVLNLIDSLEGYTKSREKNDLVGMFKIKYGTNKGEIINEIKESYKKLFKTDSFREEYERLSTSDTYKGLKIDIDEVKENILISVDVELKRKHESNPKNEDAKTTNERHLKTFNEVSGKNLSWDQFSFMILTKTMSFSKEDIYINGIKHEYGEIDKIYDYIYTLDILKKEKLL